MAMTALLLGLVLFVLGSRDSMTLPRMARPLQQKAKDARTVVGWLAAQGTDLVELSGGKGARWVVFGTASENPDKTARRISETAAYSSSISRCSRGSNNVCCSPCP